jgi:hypothetical protein
VKPKEPVADRENDIRDAKQAYLSGEVTSIRSAASIYGIAYGTLRDRLRGAQPRSIAHEKEQLLTPEEEKSIVRFCEALDDLCRVYSSHVCGSILCIHISCHLENRHYASSTPHLGSNTSTPSFTSIPVLCSANSRVIEQIKRTYERPQRPETTLHRCVRIDMRPPYRRSRATPSARSPTKVVTETPEKQKPQRNRDLQRNRPQRNREPRETETPEKQRPPRNECVIATLIRHKTRELWYVQSHPEGGRDRVWCCLSGGRSAALMATHETMTPTTQTTPLTYDGSQMMRHYGQMSTSGIVIVSWKDRLSN